CTRSEDRSCAKHYGCFTHSDWREQRSTRCACGTAIARPCRCHANRSASVGEKTVPQTKDVPTNEVEISNPSREQILESIRTGLRTVIPEPSPAHPTSGRVIFEPIANPLERFQQECVSNLMECALTTDSAASAKQLAKVLESLPAGEAFVQDDPVLHRLVQLAAPARPFR